MADAKPKKLRPSVLPDTVEAAREIVREALGDRMAENLSDGDLIDIAFDLLRQGKVSQSDD